MSTSLERETEYGVRYGDGKIFEHRSREDAVRKMEHLAAHLTPVLAEKEKATYFPMTLVERERVTTVTDWTDSAS